MVQRYYSNTAAEAVLASGITAAATTMVLDTTSGWPVSYPFTVTIDYDSGNKEIVNVTNVAGSTATIERGQDGTTGVTHSTGAKVRHDHSARDFSEPQVHMAASSGVHGRTGALVGTTDTQTLTNKNLSGASNTFPSSLATIATAQVLTNKDLTSGTNTFPSSLATLAGTQTLTNKTLTAPTITNPTVTTGTFDNPTFTNLKNVSVGTAGSGTVPLIVDGAAGQSVGLQRWRDSSGSNVALMNADGVISAPNTTGSAARTTRPYAKINKNLTQNVANATDVQVTFQNTVEETDATFGDHPNNQLVAPIAGLYMLTGQVKYTAEVGTNNGNQVTIKVAGNKVLEVRSIGSDQCAVSGVVRLAASDLITLWCKQFSGSQATLSGSGTNNVFLSAMWLAP